MTVKADNPAGKLYLILEKFDNFRIVEYMSPSGNSVREPKIKEKLSHALEIPEDNSFELLHGLFQIHKLIDEVELRLSAIEDINETLYIEPLKRIRKAYLIIDMEKLWKRSETHPTVDKDLTSLMFMSELLSRYQPEKLVPDEELKELLSDIDELYQMVLASSLQLELKTLILNQLELIRRAIHDYRIRGVSALQEAMERVAGNYFVNESLIKQESEKEAVKGYKKFLSKFVATVSFASNVTKLIDAAAKWLPLLTSGDPPDIPPVQ